MKIKLTNGPEIDTEKLSDVESLIMERLQELTELSKTYDIPIYCATIYNGVPACMAHFRNGNDFLDLLGYSIYNFEKFSKGAIKITAIRNDAEQPPKNE
jgi:hypothetical protein